MPRPRRDQQPAPDPDDAADVMDGAYRAAVLPVGPPTPEQLAVINDRIPGPALSADQVFVFRLEISNDNVDSYWTRMDPETTLRNYAADFAEGRALMNSHRTGGMSGAELPIGRSFGATVTRAGSEGDPTNPPRDACVAEFYVVRGLSLTDVPTDDVIRGIETGVISDGSVQFTGGRYICGIDNREMSWYSDDSCPHFPGVLYPESDEEGARMVRCTALIKDARAIEGSLVFDGATPNAMILAKAERMAAAGRLETRIVSRLEELTGVRMRGAARFRSVDEPVLSPAEVEQARAAFDALSHDQKLAIAEAGDPGAPEGTLRALRATWSTAYVNDLPDSAFALVESGGKKDESGLTTPRSLRHFPHHDDAGKLDEAHVRNALARIPQSDVSAADKAKAERHVKAHAKTLGIGDDDSAKSAKGGRQTGAPMDLTQQFTDLIEARMPAATRKIFADALIRSEDERITPEMVTAVGLAITKGRGARMDPDTASKVQEAMDHLKDANDSHAAALDALGMLIEAGGTEADDINPVGQEDLDPPSEEGNTHDGIDTTGLVDEGMLPNNGKTYATPSGGTRTEAAQDAGLGADVKKKLVAVHHAITDLLAADSDDDSAGHDEDGDAGRAQVPAAVRARHEAIRKEIRRPEHAELRTFLARYSEGVRHREASIADLHEWGVRALGAGYKRDLYERLAGTLDTEEIGTLRSDFEEQARRRFANHDPGDLPEWAKGLPGVGGRQTQPRPVNTPALNGAPRAGGGDLPPLDVSIFSSQPGLRARN